MAMTDAEKKAADEAAKKAQEDADARIQEMIAKTLQDSLGEVLNKAITGHMKRLEGKFDERLSKVDEQLKTATTTAKKGKAEGEENPELVELRETLKELQKKSAASEEKAAELERQRREDGHRSALAKALESGGVTGIQQRAAIAYLRGEKMVKENEEGELIFHDGQNDLDLSKGVTKFLTTADGKAFMPATGGGGSGATKKDATKQQGKSDSEKRQAVIAEGLGFGIAGE